MGLDWLSVEEKVYFEEVVSTVMKKDATEKSVGGLLKRSGLPTQVVKDIWTLVKHASILSLEEIMTLFKYIALAQAGIPLRAENLRLRVNLPRFEGVSLPSSQVYIEEGSFGEFQEEPLPESSVVSPSVEGRTKYLDNLDFPEPQQREGNQTKPFIVLRPLERKVIDDFPSPTDVEEEIPTPSFQTENSAPKKPQETDLLDFSDTTAPSPIKKPVESQEPDLLSDFFIPAAKNSVRRGASKPFVFPVPNVVEEEPKGPPMNRQSGNVLANKPRTFLTSELRKSQTTVEKPISPKELLENETELTKIQSKLIQSMRLEEAERCQEHLELLLRIRQLNIMKKEASDNDLYEDAIQHRNIIKLLEQQLATEEDARVWMIDLPEDKLTTLLRRVRTQVSVQAVDLLLTEYRLDVLQPGLDVHIAKVLFQEAELMAEVWIAVGDQQIAYLDVCRQVLSSCKEEVTRAARLVPKMRQNLQLAVQDQNYNTYIRAVPVIYHLVSRVSASVRHLSKLHPAFQDLFPLIAAIDTQWKLCLPHLDVKPESGNSGKSLNSRCGICLNSGAELVCEDRLYHPPCVNWWVARVSHTYPGFKSKTDSLSS